MIYRAYVHLPLAEKDGPHIRDRVDYEMHRVPEVLGMHANWIAPTGNVFLGFWFEAEDGMKAVGVGLELLARVLQAVPTSATPGSFEIETSSQTGASLRDVTLSL